MTTSSTPRSHPTRRAGAALGALALAAGLLLPACSDDATSSSASSAPASTSTTGLLDQGGKTLGCASLPPGEPMTRSQAVVRLAPEQVCPGYVTVVVGTPVSFVNESDATASLRIAESSSTGAEGAVLLEEAIEPAATVEQTFDAPGSYAFSSDMLPAFRGTVEVQPDAQEASGADEGGAP